MKLHLRLYHYRNIQTQTLTADHIHRIVHDFFRYFLIYPMIQIHWYVWHETGRRSLQVPSPGDFLKGMDNFWKTWHIKDSKRLLSICWTKINHKKQHFKNISHTIKIHFWTDIKNQLFSLNQTKYLDVE